MNRGRLSDLRPAHLPATLRGNCDLVPVQDTTPFSQHQVRNLDYTASPEFACEVRVTGGGTYQRMEEFAVVQSMELTAVVENAFKNRMAFFTDGSSVTQWPVPLIEINLTQTNGTLLQTLSMRLLVPDRFNSRALSR